MALIDDVLAQLIKAGLSPHKVRSDAGQVEMPDLAKLQSLHSYLVGLNALATSDGIDVTVGIAGKTWGIKVGKFIPPGA